MAEDEQVLSRVFVHPTTPSTKMKDALFPWKRRSAGRTRERALSLAAPSDLDVVHDTIIANDNPKMAMQRSTNSQSHNGFNRWESYFDLYDHSEWDNETLASEGVTLDGSEFEPEEYMEDVVVELPNKKKSKFRRLLKRPKGFEIRSAGSSRVVTPSQLSNLKKQEFMRSFSNPETSIQPLALPAAEPSEFFIKLRELIRASVLLEPLDRLFDMFPDHQLLIILLELTVAMWILYQVSVIIETVALAVKSFCIPLIIVGRLFGYL